MTPSARRATESPWLHALAGALMTGGPVWHYLYVNRYPFTQPEAILLPLAAGLVGALVALLASRGPRVVGILAFGVLMFVFVDLQFDLERWLSGLVILAICFVVPVIFEARRAVLTCLTLGAFYLASLPRGTPTPLPHRTASIRTGPSDPFILHIILDEQWGIGGLRAAGDTATADFLERFYLDRGFEVWDAAYSRWFLTTQSIPSLVSLGEPTPVDTLQQSEFLLESNPYFRHLENSGFSIHVFETTILDYCHTPGVPVASCYVAPGNSIANIAHLGGSWTSRAKLAGWYFLNVTSRAYARIHPDRRVWRRATVGGGLAAATRVRQTVRAVAGGGTAIFAHLMLPHRPISVDSNCKAFADPERRIGYDNPKHMSDAEWREKMRLASGQIRCVHRAVQAILDAVDRTVGRDGAIVVIHGDHGVRLSQDLIGNSPLAVLTTQQLNSAFPTLLAVRRPGVPAAVHHAPVPVQDFLWELVRRDFKGPVNAHWQHFVRSPGFPEAPDDTIRMLDSAAMPWTQ